MRPIHHVEFYQFCTKSVFELFDKKTTLQKRLITMRLVNVYCQTPPLIFTHNSSRNSSNSQGGEVQICHYWNETSPPESDTSSGIRNSFLNWICFIYIYIKDCGFFFCQQLKSFVFLPKAKTFQKSFKKLRWNLVWLNKTKLQTSGVIYLSAHRYRLACLLTAENITLPSGLCSGEALYRSMLIKRDNSWKTVKILVLKGKFFNTSEELTAKIFSEEL